ncbi:MAG: transcriptional regulator [Methanobacteriota archaeon]|nr:MAG: transcriptional regulator [Euryarchaeota archaeon]
MPLAETALPDTTPPLKGFASTKREILLALKRDGELDLTTLAHQLRLSKMAVYRHVKDLEEAGLVERATKRTGVGRPRLALRLAPGASAIFPKAYASITCAVLEFVEKKMGRNAVEAALRSRTENVLPEYEKQIRSDDLGGRVRELAVLRDREGYMAELRESAKGRYELFEFNCPILAVAEKYWEACAVENELFRRVLKADVETTHRVVAGDHVCRFLIKPRGRRASR